MEVKIKDTNKHTTEWAIWKGGLIKGGLIKQV